MSQHTIDRLKRLSRILYGFSIALIAGLAVGGAVLTAMTIADAGILTRAFPDVVRDPATVSLPARIVSLVLGWIAIGLMIHAIRCLMRMFSLTGQGRILSQEAARWMRRAGMTLFVLAIYATVSRTLTILLLSMGNPPGERQLTIGIEGTQFFSIFLAGVFLLVAHALVLGSEIEQENKSFV